MTGGILEPIERISEVLFGLIMVLTFTGTLNAIEAGREDVRTMLIGALGCNAAWGLVDAVMYVMGSVAHRGRGIVLRRRLQAVSDRDEAHRLISGTLPVQIAEVLSAGELERIRQRLTEAAPADRRPGVTGRDALGALAVFLFVFFSTFPVVVPFAFMTDVVRALRFSNGIALVMLFALGWRLGRLTGASAWRFGAGMLLLGAVLVAIIIALGG